MYQKENKEKFRRFLDSIKYLLRELRHFKRYSVLLPLFCCISQISLSLCRMFLPKTVLDAVSQKAALEVLLCRVCQIGALLLLFSLMDLIFHNMVETCSHNFIYTRLLMLWERKVLRMDYEVFTSGRGKVMAEKARNAVSSPNWGVVEFLPKVTALLEAFVGLAVYCGIIGTLQPVIVLILLGIFGIEMYFGVSVERKKQGIKEERAKTDRKLNYMAYGMKGMQEGKDIRIYSMDALLRETAQKVLAKKRGIEHKAQGWQFRRMLASAVLVMFRDGAAYCYLICRFLNTGMSVGDFTLYFAAITGFGNWLARLADGISGFVEAEHYVEDWKGFMELGPKGEMEKELEGEPAGKLEENRKHQGNRKNQEERKAQKEKRKVEEGGWQKGKSKVEEMLWKSPAFRFEKVSFSYQFEEDGKQKEIPVLSDFNLEIRSGEKLAVVGANGAGKSTFVKLLCGMLCPSQGRILVDGIDSREFAREDYYRLFSAVFQKSGFLPVSIAKNIMLDIREKDDAMAGKNAIAGKNAMTGRNAMAEKNTADMWECIRMAGLEEKIHSLPQGADTCLIKRISEDGTELSGGEGQRLLLARALYKNAPVLILDEPTAALDPIAENEIYQKYHQFTEGKTAVFISHRLASTRFCDRILFLENGKIAESGTHEELMALGGKYAKMFRVQSQYYQESKAEEKPVDKEGSQEQKEGMI